MDITLSIIVPAYNVVNTLEACIDSIMASTFQDFEILLVDDGSTDGSSTLCDSLAEQYNKIRVFHTQNRGLSMARNLGIDHAKGKYIGFVDSDDSIAPTMFESLVSKMGDDIQLVCCRFCKCTRENVKPLEKNDYYSIQTGEGIPYQIICNYYGAYVWSKLFRKDLLDSHGIRFKPGYIMEDQYFISDYLPLCQKACFLDAQLYYYIDTSGSIMNNFRSQKSVEYKYTHIPRSWVYTAESVKKYKKLCNEAKARAAMNYQGVLRKLSVENSEFTAEAVAYIRKHNYLLLRHRWGHRYFLSGLLLSISYPLWAKVFRR